MQKHCSDCDKDKEISEFVRDASRPDGYKNRCKECHNIRNRRWYTTTHGVNVSKKNYRKQLLKKYGLTPAQYEDLWNAQNKCCAICSQPSDTNLYVDHCHATGLARGLLCRTCNLGLGMFRDDPDLLEVALSYLKSSSTLSIYV